MYEESNVKLSKISFKNFHGTAALPEVVKIICSGRFPCEDVELADIDITYSGPKGPAVSETVEAQSGALDVVAKFGAKADEKTDLSKPLSDAWKEACASATPSTILIPKGVYLLSQATLEGPCKAPIEVQLQGTIKAPTDPQAFNCGPGHGISIGSLGKFENEEPLEGITISKCTMSDTTNGVRIKRWAGEFPGTASDIHFEDITVKNVSCPVIIDQKYCPSNKSKMNEESNVKLSKISFKNIQGTIALPEVVKSFAVADSPVKMWSLPTLTLRIVDPRDLHQALHWKGLWHEFGRHGDVVDAFISRKRNRRGRRFGFVRFIGRADAERATKRLNGFYLYGYKLFVSRAKFNPRTSFCRKLRQNHKFLAQNDESNEAKGSGSFEAKGKNVVNQNVCQQAESSSEESRRSL
ncbi:hypothetical protein GQ457_09G030380 [Hibiscus cannabinus]